MTVFLLDRSAGPDRVLVARRSDRVSTFPGKWAGISGRIETGGPRVDAIREVREETGLEIGDSEILREGQTLVVPDPLAGREWAVHPFLVLAREPAAIRLNWEHSESRWVTPAELGALEAVPGLAEALARVYP